MSLSLKRRKNKHLTVKKTKEQKIMESLFTGDHRTLNVQ